MKRRVWEVVTLIAVAATVAGAIWAAKTARRAPDCDDRGERAAWTEELCATDAECAVLEVRLTELGWIPPAPMFAGDKKVEVAK
jgi:hypothetical protein